MTVIQYCNFLILNVLSALKYLFSLKIRWKYAVE